MRLLWLSLFLYLCNASFVNAQFLGGTGDGHDIESGNALLRGYDASILFSGGRGDGQDAMAAPGQLAGYDATLIFSGGRGDGHDVGTGNRQLNGYDATLIFSGGRGDGHDVGAGNRQLAGYDATSLFSGGKGDGHDLGAFLGSLLPLTIISFEAIPQAKFVLLKWQTADEFDTDYFTIEKTRDGQNFIPLAERVDAAGTSAPGEQLSYGLRDNSPWNGISYYRLKATDFDGAFQLSELRKVDYQSAANFDFSIFPNPSDGRELNLQLSARDQETPLLLSIFDVTGRKITEQFVEVTGAITTQQLDLDGKKLAPGSYAVQMTAENGEAKVKVLLVVPKR